MDYPCRYCPRTFKRKQNRDIHETTHKPSKSRRIKDFTVAKDFESRLTMLEDGLDYVSTGFIGNRVMQNPYIRPQEYPQSLKEDPFDKMLKQYMQIMMIKQLSQSANSNQLSDLLKFQTFMDNREIGEDSTDPMINLLIQSLTGGKIKLPETNPKKKRVINVNKVPTVEIVNRIIGDPQYKGYLDQIKKGELTKDAVFIHIKKTYPTLERVKFNDIWDHLLIEINRNV